MKKHFILIISSIILLASCDSSTQKTTNISALNDSVVIQMAKEAYEFGLPLVLMDITRRKMTNATSPNASAENVFNHKSQFPDATFKDVVRPNADTYYSTASLDLSEEPLILSVPNTNGRYYMMPMLDAYTNVFASPGTRTTGNDAHEFFISGPNWSGEVPAKMTHIKAPTNMVWIIGRTQVNSKEDGDKIVIPLQEKYKLTPFSMLGKSYTPPAAQIDSTVPEGSPNDIVKKMPIDEFFNYVNRLMINNPPAAADKPILEKLATIGIKPGGVFDIEQFNKTTQEVMKEIPSEMFATAMNVFQKPKQLINGWNPLRGTQGSYGTDYTTRALISIAGLGANTREDAMYPSAGSDVDGNPLNGANKYVLHFDKGKTPPANAFWSLTMYNSEGYMVENSINRNAIGDRSNLKKNADGSIDIYIQNNSPGKDKESNWLPAPKSDFNILLRVYWPKEEMLNGKWTAQGIKKVN